MGGTLGHIFKGSPEMTPVGDASSNIPLYGAPTAAPTPSAGSKMASGAFKGAFDAFGKPSAPTQPGQVLGPGPAPTQVDASFFQPVNYDGMSGNRGFYGGGM